MQQPKKEHRYFFVDETGNPEFYAKGHKLIVGNEGCSRTFSVGFIRTTDPELLRTQLNALRNALVVDKYLANVPSMRKTASAFHAKDDCPEVRQQVYKLLRLLPFALQIVVARKQESIFLSKHAGSQDKFYDDLASKLFERQLHLATQNTIVFARRGNKTRQHALRAAVEAGVRSFRKRYPAAKEETQVEVQTAFSEQDAALQAADYMLWAVYRWFERGEDRYYEYVQDKVEVVWDVYDFSAQRDFGSSVYGRKNPLNRSKVSSLS